MKPAIAALMLWSGLLGLLYLMLAGFVVRHRYRAKVGIGDGGDPALSRAFRVHNGGSAVMRRFVTLGTPHSGTTTAYGCFSPACFDMRPASLFLLGLAGRGCDRSLWSSVDGIILPAGSARCGSSTQVASVGHLSLLTDYSVYNSVRAALR